MYQGGTFSHIKVPTIIPRENCEVSISLSVVTVEQVLVQLGNSNGCIFQADCAFAEM